MVAFAAGALASPVACNATRDAQERFIEALQAIAA
jgi:hypothetical protein